MTVQFIEAYQIMNEIVRKCQCEDFDVSFISMSNFCANNVK